MHGVHNGDSVLYKVRADAKDTVDNTEITTETECVSL